MAEQLYVRKNNRYLPYNDPYALEGLTTGAWLIIVTKGCKSIKTTLKPKLAELDAALEYLHEGLCKAMYKANEMRPRSIVMSKKEQKAWKAFDKIMGKDKPNGFEFASNSEIADKGCEYLRNIMLENKCDIKKIEKKYKIKPRKIINAISDLQL